MSQHLSGKKDSGAERTTTRRSFLRRAAVVGAAVPAALLTAGAGEADAQAPNPATAMFTRLFRDIQMHETAHVRGLYALLFQLGANARPVPTFQNLAATNLAQFQSTAQIFENTGTGAYVGAAPYISNPGVLQQATSIATIEARQAGALNVLLGGRVAMNVMDPERPSERPLTIDQVVTIVSPFVANLNGGPPLSFSLTERSAANDVAIINFALALEVLEFNYYTLNVPRFYGTD